MDRPTTGERLRSDGPPSPPRQSASVIVVRDGAGGLELLLVRRSPAQRFMAGYWVFPGGAVDGPESHRAAAVRELHEEAGVAVVPDALAPYSRWITPELIQTRFDTLFFLARAPAGAEARVDGSECVDLRWTTPAAAVAAYALGDLALVLPTLKLLEGLAAFTTVDALFEHARDVEVRPILPRVLVDGEGRRVVLPGERGYNG